MKVIIDPRGSCSYGSFYLFGLNNLCGNGNISYSIIPFRDLPDINYEMRFVVIDGEKTTKYFLSLNDSYKIMEQDYEWCDVYGSVNANFSYYPRDAYPKLISLVPSFGIQYESGLLRSIAHAMFRLLPIFLQVWSRKRWNNATGRTEIRPLRNIRNYIGRAYWLCRERLPLSAYENHKPSENNYVFFLSTLWYSDKNNRNDEGVNMRRANFIRACKSVSECHFEGGLVGNERSSNQSFSDVIIHHRETFSSWIEKTKRSAFVFNTPAFLNCHGWKLGEYLALGKCIISTPLSNDLPYPLEHGVNIHFVEESEESIKQAIEYILTHPDYRHKLERGARAYWEKHGTPEASLKLLGI